MPVDYLSAVVLSVCAITFYRAGRLEHGWGILWAAMSLLISLLALRFLPFGLPGVFLGQAGLFIGITLYRMRRKE